jgi:hypothetical protein
MGVFVETNKESIKKMFPNLIKELEGGESKVRIDSVRADPTHAEEGIEGTDEALIEQAKNALPDKFRHYSPTVIDFIRRCDTETQAEEIICYLLKRKEITEENACDLRSQLKKNGLRSFGSKKEAGFYFKESGMCDP